MLRKFLYTAILVVLVLIFIFPKILVFILLALVALGLWQRSKGKEQERAEKERQENEKRKAEEAKFQDELERSRRGIRVWGEPSPRGDIPRISLKIRRSLAATCRLKEAKKAGLDVCFQCKTVKPKRCTRCRACIEPVCGGAYEEKYCRNCHEEMRRERYLLAKEHGFDVCDDCQTIGPRRCEEGHCLDCPDTTCRRCHECITCNGPKWWGYCRECSIIMDDD